MVRIHGKNVAVCYVADGRGTAILWHGGVCQQWRCQLENGRWIPTYQIS